MDTCFVRHLCFAAAEMCIGLPFAESFMRNKPRGGTLVVTPPTLLWQTAQQFKSCGLKVRRQPHEQGRLRVSCQPAAASICEDTQ